MREPYRAWSYAGETCSLSACDDCGGWVSDPLPSPAALAKLYGEDFNYGWYRDHYPAKLFDSLIRVLQYQRLGLIPGRDARILDFGGGLGYFSRAARLLGYDARTEDPAMTGAGPTSSSGSFEVVVCHHVLEHTPHPEELLGTVRSLLTPAGTMILAVPNAASLGYETLGTDFVWSQPPFVHIHHFTPRGLRALLARAGFSIDAERFYERWDASTLADVKHARRFAAWDGRWSSTRWRWGMAQLNSASRFLALLATPVLSRVESERRPELLVVARRAVS